MRAGRTCDHGRREAPAERLARRRAAAGGGLVARAQRRLSSRARVRRHRRGRYPRVPVPPLACRRSRDRAHAHGAGGSRLHIQRAARVSPAVGAVRLAAGSGLRAAGAPRTNRGDGCLPGRDGDPADIRARARARRPLRARRLCRHAGLARLRRPHLDPHVLGARTRNPTPAVGAANGAAGRGPAPSLPDPRATDGPRPSRRRLTGAAPPARQDATEEDAVQRPTSLLLVLAGGAALVVLYLVLRPGDDSESTPATTATTTVRTDTTTRTAT